MEKEKGIFGKLLASAGVLLVVVGVFVFQGITHAEDSAEPADTGDTGMIVGGADEENLEQSDPEGNEPGEEGSGVDDPEGASPEGSGTAEQTQPTTLHAYILDYYSNKNDLRPLETQNVASAEDSYTFTITSTVPDGGGRFLGWYDERSKKVYQAGEQITLTSETSSVMLVARFEVREGFTLRYNANGGHGAPATQVAESYDGYYDFVVSNVTPIREGFEFRGWAKDGDESQLYQAGNTIKNDNAAEPLTLYAVWAEIRAYTLMYDITGGSGAPEVQACKSASGRCTFVVSSATPSRAGFEFLGWRRGEESLSGGMEITVTETNTILLADWNPIYTFTLSYTAEEGTQNLPESQKCETSLGTCTFIVTSKEPTREGYIFLGWRWPDKENMRAKVGDELVVGIDGPTDLKIMAVWSKIYSVLNSGEVFGAGERVVLRTAGEYHDFQKLVIDSVEVPAEYYAVSEGETTSIMLSNAFAQSLSSGEHAFDIAWGNGEASGIISVSQNEDGTKRFVVVDGNSNVENASLMYRPKAGAVSKESAGVVSDAATDNKESGFDAVRTLIIVAVAAFVVVYIVNRFYVKRRMDFIENL